MKKIFTLALAVAVTATSLVLTTPQATAASSVNGIINSKGRSAVSWSNAGWGNQWVIAPYQTTATLEAYIQQLRALIAQLEALRNAQHYQYQYTNNWNWNTSGVSKVDVLTRTATEISNSAATLRGTVDFNDSDEATVYFLYGTSPNNLNRETTNIVLDDSDDEDFDARITNLDNNQTYYYRAVAEDENGRIDYGSILSFRTSYSYNNDDYPSVITGRADFINSFSARINGTVDMNDFDNGRVFLVYGEDKDQVSNVENDYDTYRDIETDGENLRKVSIDNSLDGDAEYWYTIKGLDRSTKIFYALCVEFENENNDQTLMCGDTKSFTTRSN